MSINFINRQKILVAMSGGVDSSVAAALLKEQAYNLIAISMNLFCSTKSSDRGCCSASAAADAKKVADKLGFPHYVLNFKDEFKKFIIDNFIEEYKNGRTPNPCIRCNQFIKFDLLMRKAKELGCDFMATGHYARIGSSPPVNVQVNPPPLPEGEGERGGEGFYRLLKGKDPKKDQSYVLYTMNQESLAHTLFPLGDLTKREVRKIAKDLNLPVADKEESQEICFVEDDDYGRFLKEVCPEAVKPGLILDTNGKVVGKHNGIAFYTLGQRKGIGAHQGNPKYVVEIDGARNAIIIGENKDTLRNALVAEEVSFISDVAPFETLEITAKIRYNSPAAEAVLYPEHRAERREHRAKVIFKEPQRSITPGQSVVFYKGDEVLGGGIISGK